MTRDDGTVVLDGEAMYYTMPLPQRSALLYASCDFSVASFNSILWIRAGILNIRDQRYWIYERRNDLTTYRMKK